MSTFGGVSPAAPSQPPTRLGARALSRKRDETAHAPGALLGRVPRIVGGRELAQEPVKLLALSGVQPGEKLVLDAA